MVWGIAFDGTGGWEEPSQGWWTTPDDSWDNGIGAWGTKAAAAGEIEDADNGGAKLKVYKLALDIPWSGNLKKQGGVAFKWQCGDKWLGAAETGGNLSAQAPFARVFFEQAGGAP